MCVCIKRALKPIKHTIKQNLLKTLSRHAIFLQQQFGCTKKKLKKKNTHTIHSGKEQLWFYFKPFPRISVKWSRQKAKKIEASIIFLSLAPPKVRISQLVLSPNGNLFSDSTAHWLGFWTTEACNATFLW